MIKTIIVDDEPRQSDLLTGRLKEHCHDLELLAVCGSLTDGVQQIELLQPQLVFLDVELKPGTGFDLLQRLSKITFEVIFTTSFSEFALDAFKVSAIDYLLKPYSVEALQVAVEKVKNKLAMKQPYDAMQVLLHNINVNTVEKTKISLPTQTGLKVVEAGDIIRCQAERQYCTFYFKDKTTTLISKSLSECEELLAKLNFFRIHASHLINMQYVKEYLKGEGGQVKMADDSCLDVSRRKKDDFLKLLKKL